MNQDDANKGFKGLGKLAANQPPPTPPAAGSSPPQPPPPPPAPGASGPQAGAGGGVQWTPPPTPSGGGSGCLKVGLIIVGILLLGLVLLVVVGRTFAPARQDAGIDYAAPDLDQAALDAATEALAAETALQAEEMARLDACRAEAGTQPESGEVLARTLDGGGHTLRVNAGGNDGLVKLRQDGRTALSFYVRANETAEVTDIPDGSYQVLFAGGSDFSRGCGEFTTGMSVSADPDPLVFELTHEGGSSYFAIMEYTLTRQAGGNFEPEAVDPDLFRD